MGVPLTQPTDPQQPGAVTATPAMIYTTTTSNTTNSPVHHTVPGGYVYPAQPVPVAPVAVGPVAQPGPPAAQPAHAPAPAGSAGQQQQTPRPGPPPAHQAGQNTGQQTNPTGQQQQSGQAGSDQQQGDQGFPANTPWRQMTPEQQVSYWQHQSRRHEARVTQMSDYDQLRQTAQQYQQLVEQSQTAHERAVTEARRQGAAEATAAVGSRLVAAELRAAAVGRLHPEGVNALMQGLDHSKFLAPDGNVDTDRVAAYVDAVAPQPVMPGYAPAPAGPVQPANGYHTPPVQPGAVQPAGHYAPPMYMPAPVPGQYVPVAVQPAAVGPGYQPGLPPGAALAPRPDFGQGLYPTHAPTGLDAGKAAARERLARNGGDKPPTVAPAS